MIPAMSRHQLFLRRFRLVLKVSNRDLADIVESSREIRPAFIQSVSRMADSLRLAAVTFSTAYPVAMHDDSRGRIVGVSLDLKRD